jgi:hypothetical protein
MDRSFSIDSEITRQYIRFNATGTQLTVRLLPPPDTIHDDDTENTDHVNTDPVTLCSQYERSDCLRPERFCRL